MKSSAFKSIMVNKIQTQAAKDVINLKISTKGRYALEALTYMASLEDKEPQNIKTLSEKMNITERYLEQIFFILRKARILDTKRGPAGGYFISADIEKITAGDIVRAVEGDVIPVACVKGKDQCGSELYDTCLTRSLWLRISGAIDNVLDNITVSELAGSYNEMLVNI